MAISTVGSDQAEILNNIRTLYLGGGTFDADVTYSKGEFYKHGVPEPRLKFDLLPQAPDVVQADCCALPLADASVDSVVCDPPFLHAPGKNSLMGQRFGGYPSQRELQAMYERAIWEFRRILRPGGVLVFKCQDVVESGKQVWSHVNVYNTAALALFAAADLFILLKRSTMVGHNWARQVHARRGHSYFWVFKKPA